MPSKSSSHPSVVFVGGSERTGTSVLAATLCTDPTVNPFAGESKYLTKVMEAYVTGLRRFDHDTQFYFKDRSTFCSFNQDQVQKILSHNQDALGGYQKLVLKDPDCTPYFAALAEFVTDIKYLVSYRDPVDVIASRIKVEKRRDPSVEISPHHIAQFCKRYNDNYIPLLETLDTIQTNTSFLNYDSLVAKDCKQKIESFTELNINFEQAWSRTLATQRGYDGDPWATEKYWQPISKPKNKSGADLPSDTVDQILHLTQKTFERLCELDRQQN